MTDGPPPHSAGPGPLWTGGSLVVTAILLLAAWAELHRVADGHLFALALPWDAPPSAIEMTDARITADDYLIPAVVFLSLAGLVIAFAGSARLKAACRMTRLRQLLIAVFLLSVLADLMTTLWFFHDGGIDLELHPGIRLFGYAYGRTIGPVAGKLIQATGILFLSRLHHRGGLVLLTVVSCFYLLAALHNASQMAI